MRRVSGRGFTGATCPRAGGIEGVLMEASRRESSPAPGWAIATGQLCPHWVFIHATSLPAGIAAPPCTRLNPHGSDGFISCHSLCAAGAGQRLPSADSLGFSNGADESICSRADVGRRIVAPSSGEVQGLITSCWIARAYPVPCLRQVYALLGPRTHFKRAPRLEIREFFRPKPLGVTAGRPSCTDL